MYLKKIFKMLEMLMNYINKVELANTPIILIQQFLKLDNSMEYLLKEAKEK